MKKLFCVVACAMLCMVAGAVTVFGGEICEKPTGSIGGICGGNIMVTAYIDWTPMAFHSPCGAHSRYDHRETTFQRGSTHFQSCSVCGDHRFIPIPGGRPQTDERKTVCVGTKK